MTWDAFVQTAPGGDHLQSVGWAETKAFQGLESARATIEEDGRIVAGAQVLIRRLPVVGRIGYVPRGPLFAEGAARAHGRRMTERLKVLARRTGLRHLVVQPPRGGQWLAEQLPEWGFRPSALNVAPTATVLIDLAAERDELFSRMSKSTRKHVRRGLRSGLVVCEGGAGDLHAFHSLLEASGRRHGFTPYPPEYYQAMWEALRPSVRLFMVEHDGELVAAHLVVPFGDVFLSKVAAWSGRYADLYPNETLEWRMIEWAKDHGFRWYDMEGFERETAERLVAGSDARALRSVDAFKLKFGGRPVLFPPAFDYFPSTLVGHTYGRAYRAAASGGWPRASLGRLRTRPAGRGAST